MCVHVHLPLTTVSSLSVSQKKAACLINGVITSLSLDWHVKECV